MTGTSNALYILAFVLGIVSGGFLQGSILFAVFAYQTNARRIAVLFSLHAVIWAFALIIGVVLMIRAAFSMEYLAVCMFPIGYLIGAVTIPFLFGSWFQNSSTRRNTP